LRCGDTIDASVAAGVEDISGSSACAESVLENWLFGERSPESAKPAGERTGSDHMSMTDPVADMLTRIRNACRAGHKRVDIPVSNFKTEIARLLRENHYIQDYKVLDDGAHGRLRIFLMYHEDEPVIREVRRVSRPGLRRYVKLKEIPRVKNGLGMAILSTPQGVMSDRDARRAKVGGELVAVVW
jgi:small subunit ribosomal protein S8